MLAAHGLSVGHSRGVAQREYAERMPRLRDHYDEADLARLFDAAPPSTSDEVSITTDGRRLDSAEAVIAFFEELREERSAESGT
jgi:hypothetical protein